MTAEGQQCGDDGVQTPVARGAGADLTHSPLRQARAAPPPAAGTVRVVRVPVVERLARTAVAQHRQLTHLLFRVLAHCGRRR